MEAEEGREYDVVPNPYAKESEGPASEIIVWCSDLEGCNWQKALGAEMNFCPEAEQVPLDMIAGICLWHITFYGFNPDEEEETFNHMGEEESSEDGPAYMVDILSEETKALRQKNGASLNIGWFPALISISSCFGIGKDWRCCFGIGKDWRCWSLSMSEMK